MRWKDGEVAYCRRLLETRGNHDVPRSAVACYLRVQEASATRCFGEDHIMPHALAEAANLIDLGTDADWFHAIGVLRTVEDLEA